MSVLTKVFPQIGWAVPRCHWPISRLWPPTMNFKQAEDVFRCERAPDTTSSMRCSPSVPFRLTYFSTRNSSTQVSASNPVLLFHSSCHDAQDKRRKRGAKRRRKEVHEVHARSPLDRHCFRHAWLWERRPNEGRVLILMARFCSVLKLMCICHLPAGSLSLFFFF